ncbi:MAG: hypothetical protein WCO64_05410 [Actinomycetes bacterium]
MSVAHEATTVKELSQDDLQVSYAIMVNNAITEGHETDVPMIVRSFKGEKFNNVMPRRSVLDRVREFLLA